MIKRTTLSQRLLTKKGIYKGEIDGYSNQALMEVIHQLADLPNSWSEKRKIIASLQIMAEELGLEIGERDGYWGPVTMYAYSQLKYYVQHGVLPNPWRPEDIIVKNPNKWPKQNSVDFNRFYGGAGKNLTLLQLPYDLKLAWNTSHKIQSIFCHQKVSDSMHRVLTKVLDHYGEDEINRLHLNYFGGCYQKRHLRAGERWSMHSWGVAIDFDPLRNALHWGRDRAEFARSEYDHWWQFWEEEGWISLGRHRNIDWGHIQAVRI
jgi:hypothetical protein